MKLGKREATEDHRDLRLSRYLITLPKAPAVFGFGRLYGDWGMLGNDEWGDCVFAGAAHETMVWRKVRHGVDTAFDPDAVLADYSAVTGFDPSDPSTDQGTFVRDALNYRRQTGVADSDFKRHKVAAYVALAPGDWDELVTATFIFGCVGMGFAFPDSAWEQFDKGEPWDDVGDDQIDGGHYVPTVGSVASSEKITCLTWGRRQELTRAFYEKYGDEAWAMLSLEQIRSDGQGLHGFDLATFNADLEALK